MKKLLVIGVIVLFLGMTITSSNGFNLDKQSVATHDGNTLYVGGSGPGNYTKIQDAIRNASDGDMVFVYDDSSPYYENLRIKKSINVIGENKDTTIIDGNYDSYVVKIISDGVVVSGFTILHGAWYSGIYIESDECIISNNIVRDCKSDGIRIRYSTLNNCVCNNIISDNRDCGILQFNGKSKYLNINNNTILNNHEDGIALFSCSWSNIVDNDILQNDDLGIYLRWCSYNLIARNNISYNKFGIFGLPRNHSIVDNLVGHNRWGDGIYIVGREGRTRYNTISNNTVFANGQNGIYIEDSLDNIISNNFCYKNNECGIVVAIHSCNNSILDNRLENNTGGVCVSTYCENNNFSGNIFFSNRLGLGFTFSSWNNTIMNNCCKNNQMGISFSDSSLNSIIRNDFIKNLQMVDSLGSHNFWDGNFWRRPRLFPKLIFGREWRGNWLILLIDGVDWHPALKPYDIEV